MDTGSVGSGILFQARFSKPLSIAEWERSVGSLGYVSDEWWFKAGTTIVRWSHAVLARLNARRRWASSMQRRLA